MTSLTGCARPVKIDKFFTALLVELFLILLQLLKLIKKTFAEPIVIKKIKKLNYVVKVVRSN